MKYKGKIGYVTDDKLFSGSCKSGHYVLIRNKKGKNYTYVNVITSLEGKPYNFTKDKISKVRSGYIRPIPYGKSNFPRWSGVQDTKIKIKNDDIKIIKNKYINELFK